MANDRASSRVVGNPEVILELDLLGGPFVNALILGRIYQNLPHRLGRYLIDTKIARSV